MTICRISAYKINVPPPENPDVLIEFWENAKRENPDLLQDNKLLREKFNEFSTLIENTPDSMAKVRSSEIFQKWIEKVSDIEKSRYAYLLECALKNSRGFLANDFPMFTREGLDTSLYEITYRGDLLLVFYDPDCDKCRKLLSALASDEKIQEDIEAGILTLLTVYAGEDNELWTLTNDALPESWIVATDDGAIDEAESYDFPDFPAVYFLDNEKRVIAKSVDIEID